MRLKGVVSLGKKKKLRVASLVQVGTAEVWAGSGMSTIVVFDSQNGKILRQTQAPGLARDEDCISCLISIGNYIWCGSSDGALNVFNRDTIAVKQLIGHKDAILCANESARFVWTGSADCSLCAWDKETGDLRATLRGHRNWVRCVLSVGMRVWSGSDDETIRIWREDVIGIENNRCNGNVKAFANELNGHSGRVLAMIRVGSTVWSGSADRTIRVWDAQGGRELEEIKAHKGWVTCLTLKDNLVWSGSLDMSVKTWNPDNYSCVQVLHGHSTPIWSIFGCSGIPIVWTGAGNSLLGIWETAEGETYAPSTTITQQQQQQEEINEEETEERGERNQNGLVLHLPWRNPENSFNSIENEELQYSALNWSPTSKTKPKQKKEKQSEEEKQQQEEKSKKPKKKKEEEHQSEEEEEEEEVSWQVASHEGEREHFESHPTTRKTSKHKPRNSYEETTSSRQRHRPTSRRRTTECTNSDDEFERQGQQSPHHHRNSSYSMPNMKRQQLPAFATTVTLPATSPQLTSPNQQPIQPQPPPPLLSPVLNHDQQASQMPLSPIQQASKPINSGTSSAASSATTTTSNRTTGATTVSEATGMTPRHRKPYESGAPVFHAAMSQVLKNMRDQLQASKMTIDLLCNPS